MIYFVGEPNVNQAGDVGRVDQGRAAQDRAA